MSNFNLLSIESFRKITFKGKEYKRRLRISRFTAYQIDNEIGTFIGSQGTRFVVLDIQDIKKACAILRIKFKNIETYFCIDGQMCSFKSIPINQPNNQIKL